MELMKSSGTEAKTGCNSEENMVPPKPAKEVTERISKRRINAPLKPRKKKRNQSSGAPRSALIKPPKRSTPNQRMEEKKESPEHRLKLKMRAFFIELRLIIKSESTVRTKKLAPNPRPIAKFSKERFNDRIDRTPA